MLDLKGPSSGSQFPVITPESLSAAANAAFTDIDFYPLGAGASFRPVAEKLADIVNGADYATAQQAAAVAFGKVFNVPAGASVVLTVGADVASIDAALSAIAQWTIPANALVTIQLPIGAINRTTPVALRHSYGDRIQLLGATPVATTASAAGAVTGSAGAWIVPLTVASATGIAVNDYVLVRNVTGTGACLLFSGICLITGVVGSVVTVRNTAQNAAWPTATLTGAALTVLKTQLISTGCDGIDVEGSIGTIDQMAMVGNHTVGTIGLIAQRASTGYKRKAQVFCGPSWGVTSFGDGCIYAMYGGSVIAPFACVADGVIYNALAQQGGSLLIDNGISSGGQGGVGGGGGIAASSGGAVSAFGAISCGNLSYGFYAFQGGAMLVQTGSAHANVSDGLRVAWGGSIRGTAVDARYNGGNGVFSVGADIVFANSTTANNGGAGLYAEGGGSIYASGTTMANNESFGAYADGATIDAPNSTATGNVINGYTATDNGTILAPSLIGSGNGTYLCSAARGGFIRATSAATSGQTLFVDSGGLIDATGATGAPVLSYGADGIIIGAATIRGSMLLAAGANLAIGATNSAALNIDRASSAFARFARSGVLAGMVGADDGASLVTDAAAGDMVLRSDGASLWLSIGGGASVRLTSTGFEIANAFGCNGAVPSGKVTIAGSRGSATAAVLGATIQALADFGLVIDNTTA